MSTSTRLLVAGLFVSALVAPVSLAAKTTAVSFDYAGHGWDTETTMPGDHPVTLTLANGKGTFGQTSVAITVAFEVDIDVLGNCPNASHIPYAVIDHDWAVILTAPDHSQLVGQFHSGWLCLDPVTGYYVGETSGDYVMGTGRFVGAGGSWVSTFDGYHPDLSIGFRTITGSITGNVDMP